ncbi:hypothetical protein NL676_021948 [Syzygium grande]|nr:hypothetical protein NL676_021948 [Syzygium grande]
METKLPYKNAHVAHASPPTFVRIVPRRQSNSLPLTSLPRASPTLARVYPVPSRRCDRLSRRSSRELKHGIGRRSSSSLSRARLCAVRRRTDRLVEAASHFKYSLKGRPWESGRGKQEMRGFEQQLEQLQTDRDAEIKKEEPSASGTELVLYRRIAEVKANERRKALEEILYALVVQKFMDANVSLIPSINSPSSDPSVRVDGWSAQGETLEQLHSPEAYEMIQNHLSLILGNRLGDTTSVAQISKIRVGQVYAASVMYGYFLKRVDQRFQLEKTMKILPSASDDNEVNNVQRVSGEDRMPNTGDASFATVPSHPEVSSWSGGMSPGGFGNGIKPSRLRTYVMSFDGETLQSYATIRSKEAVSIIEKHTEALFGRPEIVITPEGTVDSSRDELIKISFGGLKRLVLEAVTFGSFLWDVESFVDSRYHFVTN